MEVKIVGEIKFKTCTLPVYRDLDEPLFKAGDVAELIDYGPNNIWNLTNLCEEDERLVLSSEVAGQVPHRERTLQRPRPESEAGCQGVAAGHCRGVDCPAAVPWQKYLGAVRGLGLHGGHHLL